MNPEKLGATMGPVIGGNSPYLQQQNYSLAALDERDQQSPLAANDPEPPAEALPDDEMDEEIAG